MKNEIEMRKQVLSEKRKEIKDKLFNWRTLVLGVVGVALNIALAQFALLLKLPLFLDSIGTIIVACLGGALPGITVGFVSNLINSISDPITRYYGILSIFIALIAAKMSKHGKLRSPLGALVAALIFAFIGGALGSVLTWALYGFNFGSGISAPFSIALNEAGISKFWAQFTADMAIDLADKLVSMLPVFLFLKFLPKRLSETLPLGYVYDRTHDSLYVNQQIKSKAERKTKNSLRTKVVSVIAISCAVLTALSVTIGLSIYIEKIRNRYESICNSAVHLVTDVIDGDNVNRYLSGDTEGYAETEEKLYTIKGAYDEIKYIYVYQIKPDGCHVVFDLDTADTSGGELGEIIEFDPSFEPYLGSLLKGEEIPLIVSNDAFGWLLSIYKPIYDSNGACVAYAAADVDMRALLTDNYEFIIRMISLLFGASIVLFSLATWYAERDIVIPIYTLAKKAESFDGKHNNAIDIPKNVCGELQTLAKAMDKSENDIIKYIAEIKQKSNIIAQMQRNTISSFANMVENRDANTGDHIKRTSAYVYIITKKLLELNAYSGELNRQKLITFAESAPLHDIGKITISDTILNKPGRLSEEEYNVMKTHTTAGRDIIRSALDGIEETDYLAAAEDMATYHHEWWNGKGYPDGLSETQIPLGARIMAVADVFDALISRRSYKEPFSYDEAISIIASESGVHFDPKIVEAFLLCGDEVNAVANGKIKK